MYWSFNSFFIYHSKVFFTFYCFIIYSDQITPNVSILQGNLQPLPMMFFPRNLIKTHNWLLINTCNISKIKNRTDRLSTILRQCNHQLTSKLWITDRSSEFQITLYLCCEKPVSFLWKLNWNAHWIFFFLIYFYYDDEGIKQL